jgi:hypothetical protein
MLSRCLYWVISFTANRMIIYLGRSMSEVIEEVQNPDWLTLSRVEREKASMAIALEFFYSEEEAKKLEDDVVKYYLSRMLSLPVNGATSEYRYAMAAYLAMSLPEFFLELLREYLRATGDSASTRKIVDAFCKNGFLLDDLMMVLEYFCLEKTDINSDGYAWSSMRRELRGSVLSLITEDYEFKALNLACVLSEQLQSVPTNDPRQDISQTSSPALSDPLHPTLPKDSSDNPTQLGGLKGYLKTQAELRATRKKSEREYAGLSNSEATSLLTRKDIFLTAVAYLGLLYCILSTALDGNFRFISFAHGEPTSTVSEEHRVFPPFGLSQTVWSWMVTVFFAYIMLVLTVFLYKGYLAKEKSETAADVVKSLIVMGIGLFFGRVTTGLG